MKVQVFLLWHGMQNRLKTASVSHMAWMGKRETMDRIFFPIKSRVIAVIRRLTETEHLSTKSQKQEILVKI